MTNLTNAEYRRRMRAQSAASVVTERDRFAAFLAAARPSVERLLDDTGRAWGGVDLETAQSIPERSLASRLLGPDVRENAGKGYRIQIMGGPFSRRNNFTLSLGYLFRRNGQLVLDYRQGLEAGGLRVGIGYEDSMGGYFRLAATRPHLPEYNKVFFSFETLQEALAYEWERGTFVAPFEHYTSFHDTYPTAAD